MEMLSLIPSKDAISNVIEAGNKELPTVSVVVIKMLRMSQQNDASIVDLVRLVETEPTIAARILKLVNSPAYRIRHSITDVKEAIEVLGFSTIWSLALEISLHEQFFTIGTRPGFDRMFFWQHCLSVACLSRAIAQEVGYQNHNEAYLTGLLHDLGKIIIEASGRITYSEFLDNLPKINGILIEEEVKFIGMGHDDVGAFFSQLWGFPEFITLVIKCHHQRFEHLNLSVNDTLLISIVSLANLIAWTQGIGSVNIVRHPILQPEAIKAIDISKLQLRNLVERLDIELKHLASFYNFSFPTIDKFRENLLRANIALSQKHTHYFYLTGLTQDTTPNISKSLTAPHSSMDGAEIIAVTLKAIQADFHYDRLYLMEVEKETRSLKVKAIYEAASHSSLAIGFGIVITPYLEGFIECLRRKKPVVIHGSTTEECSLLKQMGIKEMGIVPLTNNNQILGIIGVDNILSGAPIYQHDLSYVSMVANELGMALEHADIFERYRVRATIDALTRVHNRGSLDELLDNSFNHARQHDTDLAIGMIDIDHFKQFNDSFGHQAGDSVLKLIASAITKLSRPGDYVGRYGGEEFVVILNGTSFDNAMFYAERLRKEVEKLGNILVKRFRGHLLTISAGVAIYDPSMKDVSDLVSKADKSLYAAKNQGRNRVVGL
ncbi:MAG: diguanylate cyclase [Nitrospirae bacterium]|nr:diguanylate cyclase [Nitrospirota bacterium]MBF0591769.1 diguanylate cyclase [Nitrospirota bacterium]